jgi:hypothetical protein
VPSQKITQESPWSERKQQKRHSYKNGFKKVDRTAPRTRLCARTYLTRFKPVGPSFHPNSIPFSFLVG